jgi:predicted DNA-binding transcriptional regulator YafY
MAQRVPVLGEAGIGDVLKRGYDMPPLMLTPDEIEAAVLGAGAGTTESQSNAARNVNAYPRRASTRAI